MAGVVQQLVLRRTPVDVVVAFGSAVENTGVAAGRDLPVERQLEIAELITADEVFRGKRLRERAILRVPGGWDALLLVCAPLRDRRAVEKQTPAGGTVLRGEVIQRWGSALRLASGTVWGVRLLLWLTARESNGEHRGHQGSGQRLPHGISSGARRRLRRRRLE